jgi:hypothetical protein
MSPAFAGFRASLLQPTAYAVGYNMPPATLALPASPAANCITTAKQKQSNERDQGSVAEAHLQ